MTHDAALITVVIPVFNREASVLRAIDSVVRQEIQDLEVVVVDDGSTDGTADAVRAHRDPRVRLIETTHGGVCDARNAGIAAARGRWITFLDSDDCALDGWLGSMVRELGDSVNLVSCAARFTFADGESYVIGPKALGASYGHVNAQFLAGTFAVSTQLVRAVGGYMSGLKYGENSELGMRIGLALAESAAGFATIDAPLVEVAATRRIYDAQRYYDAGVQTLREAGGQLAKDRHLEATYLAIAGVAASRLGRRQESVRLLLRAWRTEPSNVRHPARILRALVSRPVRAQA